MTRCINIQDAPHNSGRKSLEGGPKYVCNQDNYNDERLFALRRDGSYLGTWDLDVELGRDPEDIAIGPGPLPGVDYVFFGDIGHNYGIWGCTTSSSDTGNCTGCPPNTNCKQRDLKVYRAVEPDVDPNQSFVAVGSYPADTIVLTFPDALMATGH